MDLGALEWSLLFVPGGNVGLWGMQFAPVRGGWSIVALNPVWKLRFGRDGPGNYGIFGVFVTRAARGRGGARSGRRGKRRRSGLRDRRGSEAARQSEASDGIFGSEASDVRAASVTQ